MVNFTISYLIKLRVSFYFGHLIVTHILVGIIILVLNFYVNLPLIVYKMIKIEKIDKVKI